VNPNPFVTLGLPERPDLDDETVRAAWRAIAAATHPDRPDGGDLARYTQASAAFAELRTPWSRSEAYADVVDQARRDGRYGAYPDAQPDGSDPGADPGTEPLPVIPGAAAGSDPRWPGQLLIALVWLPARIQRGRPLRLLIRAALAAGLSLAVLALIPGNPSAPADIAVLITWFVLTGRKDLAPAPERSR
jgi:hypothetical protein